MLDFIRQLLRQPVRMDCFYVAIAEFLDPKHEEVVVNRRELAPHNARSGCRGIWLIRLLLLGHIEDVFGS